MSRAIPRLHLVSDRRLCPLDQFPAVALAAVDGGVDAVHLREKDLPGGVLLDVARVLVRELGDRVLVLVNDRVDVALLAGAGGVQLGEQGIRPADVRALAGGRLLIGRSVHDPAGAAEASAAGADFLVAGHVYPTRSKPGQPARGVAFVEEVARAAAVPVIAIGGVVPERVGEVVRAGAHGVAVISGILAAPDPRGAAQAFREAILSAR